MMEPQQHRTLVVDNGKVFWKHLDGTEQPVTEQDATLINGLLGRDSPFPLNGPRPNLVEIALDDLRFLSDIAQQHEPGSYRASGTIARLAEVLK